MWRHTEFGFLMFAKCCVEIISRERIKIYISKMLKIALCILYLIMKNWDKMYYCRRGLCKTTDAKSEIKQGVRKRALFTLITSVCIVLGFRPALRVFTIWNVFHQFFYTGEEKEKCFWTTRTLNKPDVLNSI